MDGLIDQPLHSNNDHDGTDVTSWVSVCPRGLCKVQQKQPIEGIKQAISNSGDHASWSTHLYPRLGSMCRVRVQLKADTNEAEMTESENETLPVTDAIEATAFPRCQDSVLQIPLGDWTVLRLGEGQCDITEACVERMRAGEKCEILISPMGNGRDVSVSHPVEENQLLCATVELATYTPGKESWEISLGEKWEWVMSHKERGGLRFRSGDVWGAADSYSRALKLLITLCGLIGDGRTRKLETEEQKDTETTDDSQCLPSISEFKTTKAELHSNLSLCQLKLNQPERARASAAKATELEPGRVKAWYRLGQACQMVNELEEARQAFRKLLEIQPESPAALKALKNIASREKETNAQLGLRLSKMFS
ncbi:uncharacterized protein V6R79_023247 [Siganus canaliculatus]